MIKCLFLLVLLFIPALGGATAELVKCLMLAIGCLIWFRLNRSWHDKRLPALGLVMLGILLFSSITSPVSSLFESMVGGELRLDGWFALAMTFCFAWYCFWDCEKSYDEDGEENEHSMYWWFGMMLCVLVLGCALVRVIWGFDELALYVGRAIGVAGYMALSIPFIIVWIINRDNKMKSNDTVIGVMAILAGVYLSAETGYRSAFLGLIVGSLTALLLMADRKKLVKLGLMGLALILLSVTFACVHPYTRERFAKIGFSKLGDGPRGILAKQAWQHGFYPLGWGLESQKYLIDRNFEFTEDGLQTGKYDRFHSWPIEILVTAGWAGLITCLLALGLIYRLVSKRRHEWWICGFAGMIASFMVCSTWNPPAKQQLLLVAIATAGICLESMEIPIFVTRRNSYFLFDLDALRPWLIRLGMATLAAVYLTLIAGERINIQAKCDWQDAKGLPHEILGRQAFAVELNPWCLRDRVMLYYMADKMKVIKEQNGAEILLCQLLKMDRRHYGLESALWIRLGQYEKAYQKIMLHQSDLRVGRKFYQ